MQGFIICVQWSLIKAQRDIKMLTSEEKLNRKLGIGGTDAAAIMGLSRYKTAYDVFLDKTTDVVDDIDNDYMYWGRALEPLIVQEFCNRTGKQVVSPSSSFTHPNHPWMRANIDGFIVGQNAILECKTASAYVAQEWGQEETDQMPQEYLIQCAHYAEVLDVDTVYLAVLIGGNTFKVFIYNRDKQFGKNLIAKEYEFWHDNVLKNIPPIFCTANDVFKAAIEFGEVQVDPEIQLMIADYRKLKEQEKNISKQADGIKEQIVAMVGGTGLLVDYDGNKLAKISKKTRTGFDSLAFKKDNENLYKQYQKTTEYLEFR